jgi:hypothetical protein
MRLFCHVIGVSLAAVGLALTWVAVYWIANAGDKSLCMGAWGLGLLTMMLGFQFLPKKEKQRRAPPPNKN